MNNNILITGADGQLGKVFQSVEEKYTDYNFIFATKNEVDITDFYSIDKFLAHKNINYIINCAAYTAVDAAEESEDLAYLINEKGAEVLAKYCEAHQIVLVHVSTDYVFDGAKKEPYTEEDETAPISVYGKSKLAGEIAIQKNCKSHYIVRTSWLYSSFNANFVKSMLKLSETKEALGIVADQYGSPTYANDLANAIMSMIIKTDHKLVVNKFGIYHYSNQSDTTWCGFAKKIMELAKKECSIHPIATAAYPLPAQRPKNTIMSKNKIKNTFNLSIPNWENSLKVCLTCLSHS